MVAKDCKNFKVRINAAMAFSVPKRRECYGSGRQYLEIWECLLAGLQGAETVTDFSEYKYKDSLLEQVLNHFWYIFFLRIVSIQED